MSELQFPKYPIVGQEYDFPPYRYYWDGIKWKTKGIGYNPVNDLRDELEPRVSNNESKVFEALKRSYADAGLNLVEGSFEEGGVLSVATDVMITASGAGYSWGGPEFPHNVTKGTDPTLPSSGYVLRTDATLRSDLASENGSELVGYHPAGTGAVATTVQSKLLEFVSVKDFGAVGDGLADDTSAVQAVLDSGALRVVIPSGITVGVTGLTMAANQTLEIHGKIKKLSGASPIVSMANGCRVIGTGEINGNSVVCDGIFAAGVSNLEISGLYIHHVGGKGIATYTSGSTVKIHNNRITNITGQAISLEYTNAVTITNNNIDTAFHGIQWWGGDSDVSETPGIFGLQIANNMVSNVMGGIWGSLGQHIAVVGNHVENCSDVGIDFEGCYDFTCVGNTALECSNGCYAVFFGAKRGVFSGNTARNIISSGAGFYATTNTSYKNESITIIGNIFAGKGIGIYADPHLGLSLTNTSITNNDIVSTGGLRGISIFENTNLVISGNRIVTVGSGVGIGLEGVRNSVIRDNWLAGYSDVSASPANAGGIYLYRRSASWPSLSNIVRGNRITDYVYSIVDNPSGDLAQSKNDIEHNHVVNVYHAAGDDYNGVVANNLNVFTPAASVSATTF